MDLDPRDLMLQLADYLVEAAGTAARLSRRGTPIDPEEWAVFLRRVRHQTDTKAHAVLHYMATTGQRESKPQ